MKRPAELKRILAFLTAAALTVTATGCGAKTEPELEEEISRAPIADISDTTEPSAEAPAKVSRDYASLFSKRDKEQTAGDITGEIALNGSSASCDNSGVSVNGSTVTITAEGVYRLTGSLDGQIVVNAPQAKVQLVLDNAEINSPDQPAILAESSDKLFITTAEGSENTLSSGADSAEFACIFSKDSITLNGLGRLTVASKSSDGIHSKDDIVITGGEISVDALLDGVKGKDYVAVCGGELTVNSGEDGIKSTNAEDPAAGFIYIEGGNFAVTSGNDGFQAETDLVVTGGDFDITAGGGADSSTKVHTDDFGGGFGGFNKGERPDGFKKGDKNIPDDFDPGNFDPGSMTPPDGFDPGNFDPNNFDPGSMAPPDAVTGATPDADKNTAETSGESESDSTKGLKGSSSVEISGGTFTIDSADDTVHSDGDVLISGGKLTLNSGDDGIHAGSRLEISGGETSITKSYEGLEGAAITISGGIVELTASDDGINASDGSAQIGLGSYSKEVQLTISGGSVYVDAAGDGLDSNGDLTISGGLVLVNGPTNGANGALDSNGKLTVTGGVLIAAGSSGMAEYPDESSTQYSVSATLDSSQSAGTLVTLLDSTGKELLSFAPNKTFQNIVISCPEIKEGASYTIETGGSSGAESVHGYYTAGGYNKDGSEAGSFTADQPTSFIGKQSSMGGFGGFGGGDFKDKFGGDFQPPEGGDGRPQMPEGGFGGRGGKDKTNRGEKPKN